MKFILSLIIGFILMLSNALAEEISPFSVYNTSKNIVNNLEEICKIKNISTFIDYVELDKNKTPTDIYDQSYELLENIQKLSLKNRYRIEKNINIPQRKMGRKVFSDVNEILLEVSSASNQMLKIYGLNSEEENIGETIVITPPLIYQQLIRASALLEKLL